MSEPGTDLTPYVGALESRPAWKRHGQPHWLGGLVFFVIGCVVIAGSVYLIVHSRSQAAIDRSPGMEFGIYPGGPVGTIAVKDSPVPEVPAKRLAALEGLRAKTSSGASRPFIVRLYDVFTGQPNIDAWTGSGANAVTDSEINMYSKEGFDVDLVLRYEPVASLGPQDVDNYLAYVRDVVNHYGTNSHVQYLQITNEINVTSSSQSSDGPFPDTVKALVWGVELATQTINKGNFHHLKVGFNWANESGSGVDTALWSFIRSQGVGFRESVSWVGLDDYPGTFSDLSTSPANTGNDLVQGVAELRGLMNGAGLPATKPIHITETGYPTGPGRSESSQAVALTAMVNAVNADRTKYDVDDFEWFDLRDSNSSIQNDQERYGLLTDHYAEKPAYQEYQGFVADLGL